MSAHRQTVPGCWPTYKSRGNHNNSFIFVNNFLIVSMICYKFSLFLYMHIYNYISSVWYSCSCLYGPQIRTCFPRGLLQQFTFIPSVNIFPKNVWGFYKHSRQISHFIKTWLSLNILSISVMTCKFMSTCSYKILNINKHFTFEIVYTSKH